MTISLVPAASRPISTTRYVKRQDEWCSVPTSSGAD